MAISTKARHDLAVEIYDACMGKKMSQPAAISSMHATWLPMLRAAILHTSDDVVSADQWVDGLATAMAVSGVEWTPGSHRGKLTCARVIRLGGAVVDTPVLTARPGSLKRAAIEASQQLEAAEGRPKKAKRRVIGFGCKVPLERLPKRKKNIPPGLDHTFPKIRPSLLKARAMLNLAHALSSNISLRILVC
ncbi:hypothetical protein C8A03DRAFT_19722 [Achaetomium macrosporum]|uniref:Uncharacterized protein n=1 Tax=Achaetomium macrosporum TaxID=79813 RepID=A0AAN7C0M6_9PEZI|nr:hypothetical protein C8A03DRAFT_19722 [Achaetomium macrosporum]